MPAHQENLTIRDLEVMKYHEVDGMTLDETAEKVGVSRSTVKTIKKRPAYRDLVITAIEGKEYTADEFAEKLIQLLEAKKGSTHLIDDEQVRDEDNVTQFNALKKWGDILGVDAPKEYDVKHELATASDAELDKALEEAERDFKPVVSGRTESPALPDSIRTQSPPVLPVRTVLQQK